MSSIRAYSRTIAVNVVYLSLHASLSTFSCEPPNYALARTFAGEAGS